jgi:hypothetical protein
MKLWVKGQLTDIEDSVIEQIMKETAAMGLFFSLRNKGLVDWIQDETGEDIIFVTKDGKNYLNQKTNI